jgi:plasmid stability protein
MAGQPEATRRALKIRAAEHGRSTQAAVQPAVGLGALLVTVGQSYGGVELDVRRDKTPVNPARFD